MRAGDILRHHWPTITIAVTAAAIACAALVMLRNMPPHRIVMATGPEGDAYYEIGKRYRAALAKADVEVQLVPTAGSVENLALLHDPHSGASVALIQGGIPGSGDTAGLESLGTVFYEPMWWFRRREVRGGGSYPIGVAQSPLKIESGVDRPTYAQCELFAFDPKPDVKGTEQSADCFSESSPAHSAFALSKR